MHAVSVQEAPEPISKQLPPTPQPQLAPLHTPKSEGTVVAQVAPAAQPQSEPEQKQLPPLH